MFDFALKIHDTTLDSNSVGAFVNVLKNIWKDPWHLDLHFCLWQTHGLEPMTFGVADAML